MIQYDCNIIVVPQIQLLVNKNLFQILFFRFNCLKCEINKIQICTPFSLEMFKIASVSDPAGGAYDAIPDPLVVRGFLSSAIAVSRLRRLISISPPNKNPRPISPPSTKF